jgi:hypothetical protein
MNSGWSDLISARPRNQMLYVVAVIGLWSFIAGGAAANGRWMVLTMGIGMAVGSALVLRWYVFRTLEDAYQRGVIYRDITRWRVQVLPEATTPIKRENNG